MLHNLTDRSVLLVKHNWLNIIVTFTMPERKFPFVPGEYYHLYNRGNSKQDIFLDKSDYSRFQRMLFLCNGHQPIKFDYVHESKIFFYDFLQKERLVSIGAYVLMPNHFHILLTPIEEGDVSKFMQKLSTGYSMYFNNKYKRTGGLFEGKFKAKYIDNDVYLKYLYAYIHMNPLSLVNSAWKENKKIHSTKAARLYIETYDFSSLKDYLKIKRKESKILAKHEFPKYFTSPDSIRCNMYSWFSDRKDLSE